MGGLARCVCSATAVLFAVRGACPSVLVATGPSRETPSLVTAVFMRRGVRQIELSFIVINCVQHCVCMIPVQYTHLCHVCVCL